MPDDKCKRRWTSLATPNLERLPPCQVSKSGFSWLDHFSSRFQNLNLVLPGCLVWQVSGRGIGRVPAPAPSMSSARSSPGNADAAGVFRRDAGKPKLEASSTPRLFPTSFLKTQSERGPHPVFMHPCLNSYEGSPWLWWDSSLLQGNTP